MKPRAFTLIELLVVIALIAILAAILFPVFAQAREQARTIACLSNMIQIGTCVHMYAQDYDELFPMGTYGGNVQGRNWEVNPYQPAPGADCAVGVTTGAGWVGFNPGDGGAAFGACSYGPQFYRALMSVQLFPYLKNKQVWYCPSDKTRRFSDANVAAGRESYFWFPNWVYNVDNTATPGRYSDGQFRYLGAGGAAIGENTEWVSERTLFAEYGMLGWDGQDAFNNTQKNGNSNHSRGYNIIYFDGHAKLVPWGNKWKSTPMTGWPQASRPL